MQHDQPEPAQSGALILTDEPAAKQGPHRIREESMEKDGRGPALAGNSTVEKWEPRHEKCFSSRKLPWDCVIFLLSYIS
jgi:hypothetical protein